SPKRRSCGSGWSSTRRSPSPGRATAAGRRRAAPATRVCCGPRASPRPAASTQLGEMMAESLVVSEVFGPTWQGEGPSIGRRCGFVRLGRCNLACTWCDTPYTWDWERYDPAKELHRRAVTEVVSDLEAMAIDMVVISGGEPMLQQSHLPPFLAAA